MEFLVRVEDSKAPFFLELMKNLRPVKVEPLSPESKKSINRMHHIRKAGKNSERGADNAQILEGLKSAIEEVNLAKQGKIKLKSAREVLREL
ncbi:MAG: hypothetical protein ACHQNE_06360 [Candidatus Kapaibacterium sp.]